MMKEMVKVEIISTEVKSKSGVDGDGREWNSCTQQGWAHIPGKKYPLECRFSVDGPNKAYLPGMYVISLESYYVNRFGRLSLFPSLEPAQITEATRATTK